jgi:hypothetical protein
VRLCPGVGAARGEQGRELFLPARCRGTTRACSLSLCLSASSPPSATGQNSSLTDPDKCSVRVMATTELITGGGEADVRGNGSVVVTNGVHRLPSVISAAGVALVGGTTLVNAANFSGERAAHAGSWSCSLASVKFGICSFVRNAGRWNARVRGRGIQGLRQRDPVVRQSAEIPPRSMSMRRANASRG